MSVLIVFSVLFLLGASPAKAHGTHVDLPQSIWTFDPWIVTPMFLTGALYAVGVWTLCGRASLSRKIVKWRAVAFALGWLTVAGALVSPLHWLGERLLTFHMIEHEILMAISAPMIVVARPVGVLMWSLPSKIRRAMSRLMKSEATQNGWRWVGNGTTATMLHGIAIWGWHAPVLFDAAVANVVVHRFQHLSFFATALLFWWSVFWRSNRGAGAWHVFLTMLHTSVLGALMTLAPRPLYLTQGSAAAAWNLTPLEDQQLSGLVMWIPAGTIYAAAALMLAALWITTSARGNGHAEHVGGLS
jgi:cytochrome c oxidase assembly factor CtaG